MGYGGTRVLIFAAENLKKVFAFSTLQHPEQPTI
jgi:hypothetical protein